MFGSDLHKPRKVTTYGKTRRQQAYTFSDTLQPSPEKRKGESNAHVPQSHLKGNVGSEDRSSVAFGSKSHTNDSSHNSLDVDKDSDNRAKNAPVRLVNPVNMRSSNSLASLDNHAKEEATVKPRLQDRHKNRNNDMMGMQRKRRREIESGNEIEGSSVTSPATDIYDFPDDITVNRQPISAPSPAISKDRSRTSTKPKTATSSTSYRTRSRTSTPERFSLQDTPVTAKKADLDVYDFPDDQMAVEKTIHPVVINDSPIKKRQKTPAREDQVKARLKNREAAPELGKERLDTEMMRTQVVLPKSVIGKKKDGVLRNIYNSNGVMKRRLPKSGSAPNALFSMIREPPSPPTDSSESVAEPATPEMSLKMTLDPDTTPATPPNRASASPVVAAGSITPRQKQLWTSLLSQDATESPSELSFGKLQLSSGLKSTSRKLASLSRSASDVSRTAYTRRPRLIDTLKATTMDVEGDEMDVDDKSESANDISRDEPSTSQSTPRKLRTEISFKKTSTKVTYGQGRTYLEEKDEAKMWEGLLADEPSRSQSIYRLQDQNATEDDDDMVNASQLRAAHDLRAAGSRKRLHDELSMLLSDLEQRNYSISIRRSALKDLAEKLLDKEAASCFLESGLDRNFLKSVERDTDVVFLILEAAIIFLLLKSDPTSTVLDHIFHSQVFANVLRLLDVGNSLDKVLRDRKTNLSKMAQAMVVEFRDQLLASDFWSENKPRDLSPRVFGLQAIEVVVRKLREHGSSYTLLDGEVVGKILALARTAINSPDPDLAVLELSMSALQVTTISSSTIRSTTWPDRLVESFTSILPAILSLSTETAHRCIQLALKLAVELANDNPAACEIMGATNVMTTIIKTANDLYTQLLDGIEGPAYTIALELTLLSYGLTLNLTELSKSARLALATSSGDDVLSPSIRLFLRGKERAEDAESFEDTQTSVVNGYLAFTLGNLARSPAVKRTMSAVFERELPSRSANATVLDNNNTVGLSGVGGSMDILLETMQEFIRMNQLTDKSAFEGDEGNEVFTGFTKRLKSIVEEVSRVA